uniref:Uncharacterized protein n=1 Tax=Acrobeloides nanus TaxID=290746 RepID=A0A914DTN0_9BILA
MEAEKNIVDDLKKPNLPEETDVFDTLSIAEHAFRNRITNCYNFCIEGFGYVNPISKALENFIQYIWAMIITNSFLSKLEIFLVFCLTLLFGYLACAAAFWRHFPFMNWLVYGNAEKVTTVEWNHTEVPYVDYLIENNLRDNITLYENIRMETEGMMVMSLSNPLMIIFIMYAISYPIGFGLEALIGIPKVIGMLLSGILLQNLSIFGIQQDFVLNTETSIFLRRFAFFIELVYLSLSNEFYIYRMIMKDREPGMNRLYDSQKSSIYRKLKVLPKFITWIYTSALFVYLLDYNVGFSLALSVILITISPIGAKIIQNKIDHVTDQTLNVGHKLNFLFLFIFNGLIMETLYNRNAPDFSAKISVFLGPIISGTLGFLLVGGIAESEFKIRIWILNLDSEFRFWIQNPNSESESRIRIQNPESEFRIRIQNPDSESESRIRIQNPNLESEFRIQNPNSESESRIRIQNPNLESEFRIQNPDSESRIRIQNPESEFEFRIFIMPRGKKLTEREIGRIEAYVEEGKSQVAIAKALGRSRHLIQNFLANPEVYGKKKRKGRKRKLSKRDERLIGRQVSNSTKSCAEIKTDLALPVSRSTIFRAIQRNKNIERQKMNKAPRLKDDHITERLFFAQENMGRDWKKVIFSDEKKFNLDGPDGFNGYWRDLRKDPMYFSKRNFGGGSVMVWAAFCWDETLEIQFVSKKMDSAEYIQTLNLSLLPYLRRFRRKNLVFQQDNASIHTSRETLGWLASKNVTLLKWPACSPDLNPIENLWGIIVRHLYANNRQFQSTEELKQAIVEAYLNISQETLQNLVNSMANRIFQVINRNGGVTDY